MSIAFTTETLTNGFYFDLGLLALVGVIYGIYRLHRWLTHDRFERWHQRQVNQHLAETEVHRRSPSRTHEGDWDWPRRQE